MLKALLLAALTASLPKLKEGNVPSAHVSGREGAFAILEVQISAAGRVTDAIQLAGAAPIGDLVRQHVVGWRFEPARNERDEPVSSTVLVALVNRAPALGGSIPPLPKTPRPVEASSAIAYPERIAMPPVPPQASQSAVVLLEVEVGKDGDVASADVVGSSDGFDGIALDTIRSWKFAPATRNGATVAARAYVLFAFRPRAACRSRRRHPFVPLQEAFARQVEATEGSEVS